MTTIFIKVLTAPVQIMRHYPNTIAQTPVFVKYAYMAYTPNMSVCQVFPLYRPKGGEVKQSLITKHSSKQTKCLAKRSVWEKVFENKVFGVFLFSFKDPGNTLSKHKNKSFCSIVL